MLATWGTSTFPKPTLSLDFLGATSLDAGITFSRGSQATLFDSTGTLVYARNNALTYSEDFSNAAWTKQSSVSVSTNTTVAPDGTTTADTITADSGFGVYQQLIVNIGRQVTQSVYLRAGTATAVMFRDDTGAGRHIVVNPSTGVITSTSGTLIDSGSISMGNGWYRIYMSYAADATLVRGVVRPNSAGSGQTFIVWGGQTSFYPVEGGVTSSLTTYYPTTTAAYYAPRFDYNPSTLAPLGLLIEEQRTNSIRNNTMQGAVAGTPGTLPTNWSVIGGSGLTRTIVGTGTEDGITYIDVNLAGTTSSTEVSIIPENATATVAANGQTWTTSTFVRVVGGSLTNITTTRQIIIFADSGGGVLTAPATTFTPTTAALKTQRQSASGTATNASTARVYYRVDLVYSSGVAIDITLRIGLPQLEQGAFATSVIPTTTTALTRNADVASMTGTNFSSWYNQSEGTLYTQAAGVSGTYIALDDGTTNERNVLYFASATQPRYFVSSGGITSCDIIAGTIVANSNNKLAGAYKVNDFAVSLNGAAAVTDISGNVATPNQLRFGRNVANAGFLNGHIGKFAFYPTRLANSTLQALTA